MKLPRLTLFILVSSLFVSGCSIGRQAFYVSPFNGLNNPYHTIPLQEDSLPSALYINGMFSWGTANDYSGDNVFSAYTNVSQSRNFGDFQAFYGIGVSVGGYKVDKFESEGVNETVNSAIINAKAGMKNFGGYGFDGGINYTIPMENGEWRIIGFETSLRKEFGRYLDFRKTLPDSAATLIVRNDFYGTAGGYTELIRYFGESSYGYKVGVGRVLNRQYHNNRIRDSYSYNSWIKYNYLDVTFHVSKRKWTGYIQYNDAGKAGNFLVGSNFRLGK